MTKFRNDVTKGGCKILSIYGPDCRGYYAGVVDDDAYLTPMLWGPRGKDLDDEAIDGAYDLIPLAVEPAAPKRDMAMETLEHALKEINQRLEYLEEKAKRTDARLDELKPDSAAVTDKLQYALDTCMDKLHDLDQKLALEMKRNDELHKDAVARVNGLRADYLADQSAVQPSRVDALEERVEDAHETAAFANQKVVAWTDRVEALEERIEALEHDNKESNTWGVRVNGDLHELHNRILRLEQKASGTTDYHDLRLQVQDVEVTIQRLSYDLNSLRDQLQRTNFVKRLEALEIRSNKNVSEFVKLDQLTKETDRHLNTVGDLAQRACLQGVKLSQRLEVLERIVQEQSDKRQPSEKGVWVTREMLEKAMKSFTGGAILAVAENLGLKVINDE